MTHQQEIEQTVAKWDILLSRRSAQPQHMTREQVAIILENQRVYNETLNDVDSEVNTHRFLAFFRRISIPIVFRVLQYIKTPQLINYQPILDNEQMVEGHLMKSVLSDASQIQSSLRLDAEAELCFATAQELAMEIDLLVLNELRNHAGIICYVDPTTTEFTARFYDIVDEVKRACGFTPNWVVASSPVAEYITEATRFEATSEPWLASSLGIRHLGTIDAQLELYENTLTPEYELLLGYKGSPDALTFSPKVLLDVIPLAHKPQQARISSQFNITWSENSRAFYARVTVKSPD